MPTQFVNLAKILITISVVTLLRSAMSSLMAGDGEPAEGNVVAPCDTASSITTSPRLPALPPKDQLMYTACYCEENIYKLAELIKHR